jgi:hypothetical protein
VLPSCSEAGRFSPRPPPSPPAGLTAERSSKCHSQRGVRGPGGSARWDFAWTVAVTASRTPRAPAPASPATLATPATRRRHIILLPTVAEVILGQVMARPWGCAAAVPACPPLALGAPAARPRPHPPLAPPHLQKWYDDFLHDAAAKRALLDKDHADTRLVAGIAQRLIQALTQGHGGGGPPCSPPPPPPPPLHLPPSTSLPPPPSLPLTPALSAISSAPSAAARQRLPGPPVCARTVRRLPGSASCASPTTHTSSGRCRW